MKILTTALVLYTQLYVSIAQRTTQGQRYTDPLTGINLAKYQIDSKFVFGIAVPQKNGTTEYIGHVVGPRQGWAGISHTRSMTKSLLLVFWSTQDRVQASFRYATDYDQPQIYQGDSNFTELKHDFNSTHFMITYRCERCFSWSYEGVLGNQNTAKDSLLFGWAASGKALDDMNNRESPVEYHDRGVGLIEASVSLASLPDYEAWVGKKFPKASASQTPSVPNVSPLAIAPVLVTTKVPAVHVSSDSLASKTPKETSRFLPKP